MRFANDNLPELIKILPGYDPYLQAGDCWFDKGAAEFVIEFIETGCTHVKGTLGGKPLVLLPWQKAWYANLFGWKRPDGTRRFRETLVYIPRGNSKTTMGAALVNTVLFTEDEPGAELYSSAAEREQARLCFEITGGMIRNQPALNSMAEVFKYSIVVGDRSYKAIAAQANTKHGLSASLVVNDELHAHKTAELTEVLMTSTLKRSQPIVAHLTTADYDRESVCNQKYDYACKVRDNIIDDPAFLPVIYEAKLEDDWTDPAIWAKANPNYEVMDHEYLERECKRAQVDPVFRNTFLRLHLNIRTTTDINCIKMEKWDSDACSSITPLEELAGKTCYGGLDLSAKTDITSFVLVFPDEDGSFDVLCWFWAPEDAAAKRAKEKNNRSSYEGWKHEGLMELIPGARIEQGVIRNKVNELGEAYRIREIAYDPWNGEAIRQELEKDGFEMVEFIQGIKSFTEPMKEYLSLIDSEKIRHGGNKVLRWMASNLAAKIDESGNIRPDKKNSSDKIDGQVATIMALARAIFAEDATESVYESRGVLFIGDE